MAAMSTYPIWDDHEVVNDYEGATVDPGRYAAGRQAFLEYWPIRETGLLSDPSCAGDPLYRTFKWGADVEVFVLDERSCRSADASAAPCSGDLAPTLPPTMRTEFPFSVFLPPSPPAGCLASVNDVTRTVLGPVQKAAFKSDLLNSTAKFKFVINEFPIQQFYVLPFDRWEGYGGERAELLNFIRTNNIENVAFLTTDTHANLVTQVSVDRYTNPTPVATELVTGPIATNPFEPEVFDFGGQFAVDAVNKVMDIPWLDCRDLNVFSYGLIDVDVSGGPGNETAAVNLLDDTSASVMNQVSPPSACSKTFPNAPSISVADPDTAPNRGDGAITIADISAIVAAFGGGDLNADINADGFVTISDISLDIQWFGLKWPPLNAPEGRVLRLFVRGSDPNGDPLTFSAPSLPAGATFNPTTRQFQWTPSNTQGGPTPYRIPFVVSDGSLTDSDGIPVDVDDTMP
jgi:hypothetical protein